METEEEKNKGGRPTKYDKAFDNQGYKLSLLGMTDEELAKFFDIQPSTLYEWKLKYPTFSEAIKAGKEIADADVVEKLIETAKGYTYDDIDIRVIDGAVVKTPVKKFQPGNVTAQIYWLNNRRKINFKARQNEEDAPPVIISVNVTKEEQVSIAKNLSAEYLG